MDSPWIKKKRRAYGLGPEVTPFEVWLHDVKQRPSRDMDAQILVSGDVRKGKSTLAYKIGKLLDPTFDHTRMVYNIQSFREVADDLPDGESLPKGEVRVVIWDEIIEGGMNRDWNTKANKEMAKFFTVCGERNLIGFQLAPHIDLFDTFLRKSRATDWIMIPRRGLAKGHVRASGGDYPGKEKRWDDCWMKPYTKEDSPDFRLYKEAKRSNTRHIGQANESDGGGGELPINRKIADRFFGDIISKQS